MRTFRLPAFFWALSLTLCLVPQPGRAADSNEARLREQLRATALQLRDAEAERASLQAAKTADDEKIKSLGDQLAALQKRVVSDRDSAEKAAAEARATLAEREAALAETRVQLGRREAELKKQAADAAVLESKRASAASKVVLLERRVAELTQRNRRMFSLGMEVLSRYEKFGLGDALTAREPFIGLTRVKFENLIQDFADKLADARIQP